MPALQGGFCSVTRTPTEISIVCEYPPDVCTKVESGWCALEIVGPLDFALTGVLASFATPLAAAGISIFAISTFDTDYLLVKKDRLEAVNAKLSAAGHRMVNDR